MLKGCKSIPIVCLSVTTFPLQLLQLDSIYVIRNTSFFELIFELYYETNYAEIT